MKNCIFGLLCFKCETKQSEDLYEKNIESYIIEKICNMVTGDCSRCKFFVEESEWSNCSKERLFSKIQYELYLEGFRDVFEKTIP